ncbi:SacI homology domain-containing protein [Dipodascopsis tothii]|uniref:SacI homology domain-containing protein n=1 Tax=Dipodascopsis tothii TaxID=44089 RepID=UPI0034CFA8BC
MNSFDYFKDEEHPGVPAKAGASSDDHASGSGSRRASAAAPEAEDGLLRMCKYTLYETKTRFYLIGSNMNDTRFKVLKIDLLAEQGELALTEDDAVYTHAEIIELLETIQDGNPVGGLIKRLTSWGVVGFIRFTHHYYMIAITKRSAVAMLGGYYIYHIDATELIPLCPSAVYRKPHRNSQEARFLNTFQNLDLSKTFYFSYTYDITHTLQRNLTRARERAREGAPAPTSVFESLNEMFVWNHYLLKPAIDSAIDVFTWCLPIIHGFIDQANISVFGRNVSIAIIARRSHYFAGARFLKRGANDQGYVANDVETEQIVADMLTTSFHGFGGEPFGDTRYTSFVQHRGSIPLFWTQDVSGMSPKPPIELNVVDPFYSAAALHFDDLFKRYGTPIVVFNLIKIHERTARESILLYEFENCLRYLNQFLPDKAKILYTSWDMSRASKGRDKEVIEFLEEYADKILKTVRFFHNGPEPAAVQTGVCRTNCIDCLDRTNAAQFVIGKRALGYQLHALGIIDGDSIDYDTDAVNLLTEMYHDHGDTIALQYGGSHLVNTMETYRRINQWTSHSRDVIESIRRYYSNSFVDGQRQEAINLFLGNYVFEKGQPMLWDLSTDYYLHHGVPTSLRLHRRSYKKWWTPINIARPPRHETSGEHSRAVAAFRRNSSAYFDSYWMEYYKPKMLSSFSKIFQYNINSTLRYIPTMAVVNGKYNFSPFEIRQLHIDHHKEQAERDRLADDRSSVISVLSSRKSRRFLDVGFIDFSKSVPSSPATVADQFALDGDEKLDEKSDFSSNMALNLDDMDSTLWPFADPEPDDGAGGLQRMVDHLLRPAVSDADAGGYEEYLAAREIEPLTTAAQPPEGHDEYETYVSSAWPRACDALVPEPNVDVYQRHVRTPAAIAAGTDDDDDDDDLHKYQHWIGRSHDPEGVFA